MKCKNCGTEVDDLGFESASVENLTFKKHSMQRCVDYLKAKQAVRWGVWYDDGHIQLGFLNFEGSHGRPYRMEFDTEEEATEKADEENAHDKDTYFVAMPLSGDVSERLREVRREVLAKRKRRR
jgi:hypothetical protein